MATTRENDSARNEAAANHLRSLKTKADLTYPELSKLTKIPEDQLKRLLRNRAPIRMDQFSIIVEALNRDPGTELSVALAEVVAK